MSHSFCTQIVEPHHSKKISLLKQKKKKLSLCFLKHCRQQILYHKLWHIATNQLTLLFSYTVYIKKYQCYLINKNENLGLCLKESRISPPSFCAYIPPPHGVTISSRLTNPKPISREGVFLRSSLGCVK